MRLQRRRGDPGTLACVTSPRHSVILRHTGHGADHHDWMLSLLEDPERALLTVRLNGRPDHLRAGDTLRGVLLPPHRTIYLTYEGPLSGGRGTVTRVARGNIIHADDPACMQPDVLLNDPAAQQTTRSTFTVSIAWEGHASDHTYRLQPTARHDGDGHPEVTICCIPSPSAG